MQNTSLTIQDVLSVLPRASTAYTRVYTITDFHAAVAAPVSRSDAPGVVYLYRICHPNGFLEWKVGRTNNPLRRLREWRRQCYLLDIQLIACVPTYHASRLVHRYFKLCDAWLEPSSPCTSCAVWHQEKIDATVVGGEDNAICITQLLQEFVDAD
ncbi:hypothetical protein K438DRAFT_2000248 [Mycena galopus ATCC 62051]|nr:hypothetical protein K438DRAFT_2000248 [Mycena galopus ATCC 62051]